MNKKQQELDTRVEYAANILRRRDLEAWRQGEPPDNCFHWNDEALIIGIMSVAKFDPSLRAGIAATLGSLVFERWSQIHRDSGAQLFLDVLDQPDLFPAIDRKDT